MDQIDAISEKKKRSIAVYFFSYTALFAILFFFCYYYWMRKYNKSILCTQDAMNQHYLIFVYMGRWIRECLKTILFQHSFNIPMFDIAIGTGGDIIYSLCAHISDPFNWIAALIPESYSSQVFSVIIIFKLYLSGLSFSYLCFRRNKKKQFILIGALVYTFSASGYILILQPLFLNLLYLFPLFIAGVDDLWGKKKSGLFLFSAFLIFANYFYFAYMAVILGALYGLALLYFDRSNFQSIRAAVGQIGKYLLHGLLAAGLAMPILLPVVIMMRGSSRVGADFYVPPLYSGGEYKNFVSGFTSSYMMMGRDCYIGYCALTLTCIVVLFVAKGNRRLRLEFLALTCGMCLPGFGWFMNGFSYCANRWVFAYTLLVSLIVVEVLPLLKELTARQMAVTAGVIGIYIVAITCWNSVQKVWETDAALSLCLLYLMLTRCFSDRMHYILLMALTALGVMIPARYHFSANYENALFINTPRGEAYETVTNAGAMPLIRDVGADAAERFDEYEAGTIHNETMLYGISGMDLYLSNADSNLESFHDHIALLTNAANTYYGLNRRSELEQLMGVKHFLITEGDEKCLPYGYSTLELAKQSHGEDYSCYLSDRNTSLFHTFDHLIGEKEYLELEPYERQQALMQAIVVDDSLKNTKISELTISDDKIPYDMELQNMEEESAGKYFCGENGGSIILHPRTDEAPLPGENYIYLENIDYENGEANSYSVRVYGLKNGERTEYTDRLRGTNRRNHIYEGRHNWLIQIGCPTEADEINAIEIHFESAGRYSLQNIQWYVRSTQELENSIEALETVDADTKVGVNLISATMNFKRSQHVLLSVPYIKGWKLKIDGRDSVVRKADDAFIYFDVPEGEHQIELTYETPGLKTGVLLAVISFIIVAVILGRKESDESLTKIR